MRIRTNIWFVFEFEQNGALSNMKTHFICSDKHIYKHIWLVQKLYEMQLAKSATFWNEILQVFTKVLWFHLFNLIYLRCVLLKIISPHNSTTMQAQLNSFVLYFVYYLLLLIYLLLSNRCKKPLLPTIHIHTQKLACKLSYSYALANSTN